MKRSTGNLKNKKMILIIAGIVIVFGLILAAVLILGNKKLPAVMRDDLPTVDAASRDETIYAALNMDGSLAEASAVIHLIVNDYGRYYDASDFKTVVNLSDSREPVFENGAVIWDFVEPAANFYYQGDMTGAELPYIINISYELNGIGIDNPAGVTGRLSLKASAAPNPKAEKVYTDNFMCRIQFPVNIEECQNIDETGISGILSGNVRNYFYMLLPGESGKFEISMDVKDYSSEGMTITLSVYTAVSSAEAADSDINLMNVYNSAVRLHDHAENVSSAFSDLGSGLGEVADNALGLERGYSMLLEGFLGGLNQAEELKKTSDAINSGIETFSDNIGKLEASGDLLKAGLAGAADVSAATDAMMQLSEMIKNSTTLSAQERQAMLMLIQGISSGISSKAQKLDSLSTGAKAYIDGVSQITSELPNVQESVKQYTEGIGSIIDGVSVAVPAFELLNDGVSRLYDGIYGFSGNLSALSDSFNVVTNGQLKLMEDIRGLSGSMSQAAAFGSEELIPSFTNGGEVASLQFVLRMPEINGSLKN